MAKVNKKIKHPENLKVKSLLKYGDAIKLADASGKSIAHVRDVLNGRRAMSDSLIDQITKLIAERKKRQSKLDRVINS